MRKAGVVDFIEKPFGEGQLLAAITAALEQGEACRGQDATLVETRKRLAALSPREREVLDGLIDGGQQGHRLRLGYQSQNR